MRKLLASSIVTAIAAIGVLTAATPASAGPLEDAYHEVIESPVGEQAVCVIVEEFSAAFGEQLGEPFATVLRQVDDRVVGCDANGSEAIKLVDRVERTVADQITCVIVNEFATAFEDQAGQPEPFSSAFVTTAAALRTFEAVYCADSLDDIGDPFRHAPAPKDRVPEDLHPLYDAATVFPCAFLSPTGSPFGQGIGSGPYDYLDCGANQFLPEGF